MNKPPASLHGTGAIMMAKWESCPIREGNLVVLPRAGQHCKSPKDPSKVSPGRGAAVAESEVEAVAGPRVHQLQPNLSGVCREARATSKPPDLRVLRRGTQRGRPVLRRRPGAVVSI